jgi:hypothetical protein
MRNHLVEAASDVLNAVSALRLKRHTLRSTSDGVVIQQAGKPDLLLTYDAARRWAAEVEEAQANA